MNIYLIRHGRQDSTLCNVDVDLSEEGCIQAELVGKRLENYHIDGLYSSDLIRAKHTAEIISKHLELNYIVKKEFKEISFGLLEGKTREYIEEHFAEFKREQDLLTLDIPYPEGENGEDVSQRAYPVINELTKSGHENVVIVTHGGVIRSLLTKILGIDSAKKLLFSLSLENCSITHIRYCEEKNRFYLERLNDFAHIEHDEQLLRKNW